MRLLQRLSSKQEAGFVSIFTVLFFILLITIITVGFLRITIQEQRQSIDNDLTASALASAEAGVEDAKRAILSYTKMPAGALRTQYSQALRSPLCNALFGPAYPLVRNDLGLDPNGQVSGQAALGQNYTCLTVNMDTDDYINRMDVGKSDYIPLRADGPYSSIVMSWHLTESTGDRQPAAYANGGSAFFPATGANSWATRGYPAYLRVQVFGHPGGNFNLDQLEAMSHTAFLMPTNFAAGFDETNAYNIETGDSRTGARTKSAPVSVRCKGTPPNVTSQYACSVKLAFNGAIPTTQTMFLRVTPIYGPTNFKVELEHSAGNPKLVEVQPIVDSTGRAGDVFRRVQARVRLDAAPLLPEYTLETAQDLCKDFVITDNPADFIDNC